MTTPNKLEVSEFNIGEIVTLKSHPLLYDYDIKGDGKYVPPLMIVKEVIFENKQKKTNEEITGKKIAERIKYICVYFDDNKSEFNEVHIYQSMLSNIENLHIGRIENEELSQTHTTVVQEILNYPSQPEYIYGKIIYFKTKKLEVLKKRTSKKVTYTKDTKEEQNILQYVVNYATPEFIISGFKKEANGDLFYNNGKPKRLISTDLVKIQWFNPIQQKFSEQYLPFECFTDIQPFKTNLKHNDDQFKKSNSSPD